MLVDTIESQHASDGDDPAADTHMPAAGTDSAVADEIVRRIGPKPFQMWFGSAALSVEDGQLRIETGSSFEADWIARRFGRDLDAAAAHTLGDDASVQIVTRDAPPPRRDPAPPVAPTAQRAAAPRRRLLSLSEFVVGPSNRLAWAATSGIVDGSAPLAPLFIHGPCGVGKTHLLQGLCRSIGERDGWSGLRYVTGEQFTNEYISAVRSKRIERFRRSLRRLKLLAIDDVHFVAGKQRTQEELLHTIDAINLSGARVVLASDAAPDQIRRFQRGLVSRCRGGNVVGIEPPDPQTCRALACRLAAVRGLALDDAATDLVAAEAGDEVRAMEGLLTRVAAARMLTPGDGAVTCSEVRAALNCGSLRAPIRLNDLVTATADVLGLTVGSLTGNARTARVVLGRAMVAWLARDCTGASFPEIAEALKRRSHSSAIAGQRRIDDDLKSGIRVPMGQSEVPLGDLLQRVRRQAQP
ncbi:MAG: DnaA/Hda family protein [Phycisphaerales bacterium]|nr:DnaA/Hda family protein [Phycisphaerales bacterium]